MDGEEALLGVEDLLVLVVTIALKQKDVADIIAKNEAPIWKPSVACPVL